MATSSPFELIKSESIFNYLNTVYSLSVYLNISSKRYFLSIGRQTQTSQPYNFFFPCDVGRVVEQRLPSLLAVGNTLQAELKSKPAPTTESVFCDNIFTKGEKCYYLGLSYQPEYKRYVVILQCHHCTADSHVVPKIRRFNLSLAAARSLVTKLPFALRYAEHLQSESDKRPTTIPLEPVVKSEDAVDGLLGNILGAGSVALQAATNAIGYGTENLLGAGTAALQAATTSLGYGIGRGLLGHADEFGGAGANHSGSRDGEPATEQGTAAARTGKPAADGKAARKRVAKQKEAKDSSKSAANQDSTDSGNGSRLAWKVHKVIGQSSVVSNGYDSDTRDE